MTHHESGAAAESVIGQATQSVCEPGIANIIDRRRRPYRFIKINAIVEPTCHDNSCKDADQAPYGYAGIGYDQREHVTLADALRWAQTFPHAVTLYIYDEDAGIYAQRDARAVIAKAGRRP